MLGWIRDYIESVIYVLRHPPVGHWMQAAPGNLFDFYRWLQETPSAIVAGAVACVLIGWFVLWAWERAPSASGSVRV